MENNLPELRDIHLPAEGVSLWPLAYGWWLLALLVILLAVFAVMYKIWKLKSKKHYALNMLASLDLKSSGAAVELSEILVVKRFFTAPLLDIINCSGTLVHTGVLHSSRKYKTSTKT